MPSYKLKKSTVPNSAPIPGNLWTVAALTVLVMGVFACGQQVKSKANLFYKEGMEMSRQANTAQDKGDFELADRLNKTAIEKFRAALQIDSSFGQVRPAMGHALFMNKQYQEAIPFFKAATQNPDKDASSYREMAICQIELGDLNQGRQNLDKAFAIDTSSETRDGVIEDLLDLADLSFSSGEEYIQKGEPEMGTRYRKFSVDVLKLAFGYDQSRKDIALVIADFAGKLGDKELAAEYEKISE